MTRRAVLIGILGAILVPVVGYYADHVAHVNRFVAGQFPIAAYGPLVLVVLFLNPLLRKIWPRACFTRSELAVIMVGVFVGASIVNNGLLRYFTRQMIVPIHTNLTKPGWKSQGVLEDVPEVMMLNSGNHDDDAIAGYIMGKGKQDAPIPLSAVPWGMLIKPLAFWGALIILFGACSICLAVIVHPQWSGNEHLQYPTIEFANTMMGEQADGAVPLYRQAPFLIGVLLMIGYHLLNGCAKWWPDYVVGLPLRFDFSPFADLFSWGRFSRSLFYPTFWPLVIALAFFLPKDISFSVGISQPLVSVVATTLVAYDLMTPGGTYISGDEFQWQRAGSCVALVIMLTYLGRNYYKSVVRSAFLRNVSEDEVLNTSAQAFRILLICAFMLVVILSYFGQIPWPFAVIFIFLTMVVFITVSRIIAEVGIFYVQVVWYPIAVMLPLCGGFSLGASAFIAMAMISTVFSSQPEESLMPFVTQGLKLGEQKGKSNLARYGLYALAAYGIAIAVAVPCSIWVDYNYGGAQNWWASYGQPNMSFDELAKIKIDLKAKERLEASQSLSTFQRVTSIRPKKAFAWSFVAGLLIVVAVYMARLRWAKWPLHPILFLVWNTWVSHVFFWSFLAAWVIRLLADKYVTRAGVKALKVVMVGVVSGELLGGMFWLVVGWIYFACTGNHPPYYNIFPY